MKKSITLLLLAISLLAGCEKEPLPLENQPKIIGEWVFNYDFNDRPYPITELHFTADGDLYILENSIRIPYQFVTQQIEGKSWIYFKRKAWTDYVPFAQYEFDHRRFLWLKFKDLQPIYFEKK